MAAAKLRWLESVAAAKLQRLSVAAAKLRWLEFLVEAAKLRWLSVGAAKLRWLDVSGGVH